MECFLFLLQDLVKRMIRSDEIHEVAVRCEPSGFDDGRGRDIVVDLPQQIGIFVVEIEEIHIIEGRCRREPDDEILSEGLPEPIDDHRPPGCQMMRLIDHDHFHVVRLERSEEILHLCREQLIDHVAVSGQLHSLLVFRDLLPIRPHIGFPEGNDVLVEILALREFFAEILVPSIQDLLHDRIVLVSGLRERLIGDDVDLPDDLRIERYQGLDIFPPLEEAQADLILPLFLQRQIRYEDERIHVEPRHHLKSDDGLAGSWRRYDMDLLIPSLQLLLEDIQNIRLIGIQLLLESHAMRLWNTLRSARGTPPGFRHARPCPHTAIAPAEGAIVSCPFYSKRPAFANVFAEGSGYLFGG